VTDGGDERRMAVLEQIFERSTHYEVAFWDMAYGEPDAG
jgi:thiaminase